MSDFYKPEHSATVNALIESLDGAEIARRCNEINGSNLNKDSAITLARQVALTALQKPGKRVQVAGIAAEVTDGKLGLMFVWDAAEVDIKGGEDLG